VFRSHFSPYKVEDNRSKTQGEIGMRSFLIVMTVTGCCAPLTIRTTRISNKRCQIRIPTKPDCAPHPTTVSTSNARRGNSKIISAMWRFSGVNGVCQSERNNKTGRGFGDSRKNQMKDETARAGFLQMVKGEFSHEISEF
jgi:hypothetical protein